MQAAIGSLSTMPIKATFKSCVHLGKVSNSLICTTNGKAMALWNKRHNIYPYCGIQIRIQTRSVTHSHFQQPTIQPSQRIKRKTNGNETGIVNIKSEQQFAGACSFFSKPLCWHTKRLSVSTEIFSVFFTTTSTHTTKKNVVCCATKSWWLFWCQQ